MRIAFIFPPYSHKKFAENLMVVDSDFGVFPPISVAYTAAICQDAGHDVTIVDANAEKLAMSEAISRLKRFRPDAIGFYFSTYMFHDTMKWARAVKAELGVPVVAGGINLLLYPEESIAGGVIDYGIIGPAHRALPELLAALEKGSEPEIPGLCYRNEQTVITHPPRRDPVDFDAYPHPARQLLPNDRYYSFISQRKNFTIMVTALGCPYKCTFCAITRIPYRVRSVDSVLDEMEACQRLYNINEFDIFDADFSYRRKRAEAICRGILERGLKFEWSCRARIDSVDRDLLKLMAESGCRQIYYGIETPDEVKLQLMKKNITVDKVWETINASKDLGIRPLGFFMTGVPEETRSSLLKTILFSLRLGLDYAQFSRTIAKPGTELDRQLIEAAGKDYWREYILGSEPERRMKSPWTTMHESEIEFWTKLAYFVFYYRPTYVLKAVLRLKSFEEFKRSARTAAEMLYSFLLSDL